MKSERSVVRHRALYRAALKLYPRTFRESYSDPMTQLFGDCVRDLGARVWLRTVPDLVRTVPTERIEATMARLSPQIIFALVVLAAAIALGLGGVASFPLLVIAVAVVVANQRRVFTSLPRGERAPLRRAVVQAWWAPVAGLLGLAMIVFGIATIFEANNWGGRIFGSSLLMAFGLAMFLGLMRRPFNREAGNTLILLATVPGLLFFWVIVPPLLAILVWVGVLSSGFSDQPVEPATL